MLESVTVKVAPEFAPSIVLLWKSLVSETPALSILIISAAGHADSTSNAIEKVFVSILSIVANRAVGLLWLSTTKTPSSGMRESLFFMVKTLFSSGAIYSRQLLAFLIVVSGITSLLPADLSVKAFKSLDSSLIKPIADKV